MKSGIWHELLAANDPSDRLTALAYALGGWLIGQLLLRLSQGTLKRWTSRTSTAVDDVLLTAMRGPLVVIITVLGLFFAYEHLTWPAKAEIWLSRVLHVAIALSITWLFARIISRVLQAFLSKGERRTGHERRAIPAIAGALNVLIWSLGLIVALSNAGYDVGALLAGIGIGGLAMAMAAKDTLANVFGGITVFADEPFRTDDRIRIGEHTGRVEAIGLRSTRLRTVEGPVVVIPNHAFTESVVVNLSAEPAQRVRLEIALVLETPADRIERSLSILGEIVSADQEHLEPGHTASLHDLRPDSLGILFIYHVRKHLSVEQARTRVNLEVLRRFNAEGLRFAYPTSMQYAVQVQPG